MGAPVQRRSNARLYAIYGALFGVAFPLLSTLFYAHAKLGGIGQFVRAQHTMSLLWVIDTAPVFLGLFAWLAGRRQDAVELLVAQVRAASTELERTNAALEVKNVELARTNAALVEASRLKSQFLANMSHELRTPLNAIIGFSRIVLRKTESILPERQVKNLQTVHDSGKHLLEMVNDLLDIERIEAGMLRVSPTRVDVSSMLREVVSTLTPAALDKKLSLVCEADTAPVLLRTDAVRLRQVLDNLVNNAIKYSDTGTIRVRLELRPSDGPDQLRLIVADEGVGIPAEQLDKIFEAFHQVDSSSTRAQGGVGLGLHLVRRLVELIEGKVGVTSEVGKGSTFTVTFPASKVEHKEAEPAPGPLEATGEGPLILVIDDQIEAIDILRTELVEAGFRVEAALSGEEGLARAAATRPAAILLDIVMPNMDGWTVLKQLRSDAELSSTPVIVTSILDDAPRAWDLGIVGWLTKPVAPEDFLEVFRRIGIGVNDDVLVVEDDRATQDMIAEHLSELGIQPRSAMDGPEAIAAVDAQMPRVVILDLMLPHLDGFQVLDHLRARRNGHDVPVVVYTAMDLTPEERKRLNGGVVEVISKSAGDGHQLAMCVRRALARKQAPEEAG